MLTLEQRIEQLENSVLSPTIKIKVMPNGEAIYEEHKLPSFATKQSAAVDLRAAISEPITLQPNEHKMIGAGYAIHIDNPFYCALLLPRSGLGHKYRVILANGTGLIDSDYQGELGMSILNEGEEPFTINPGDRIAQMMFARIAQPVFDLVTEFEQTERGEGGFGHSGRR